MLEDWINAFYARARENDDRERLDLCYQFQAVLNSRKVDLQTAENHLDQLYLRAEHLSEKCWMMIVEGMRIEFYIIDKIDLLTAVKIGVRAAVEARKPEYDNCPTRDLIYMGLLTAYMYVDPVGYADSVREAIAYIERELNPDLFIQIGLKIRLSILEMVCENLDLAQQIGYEALALTADYPSAQADVYVALCEIMHRRGELQLALQYAQLGEQYWKQKIEILDVFRIQYIGYQMVYLRKLGDGTAARELFDLLQNSVGLLPGEPFYTFYESMVHYHQTNGELDKAITSCRRLIEASQKIGSLYAACESRVHLCRLLGKAERSFDDELANARVSVQALIAPSKLLAQLDRIAQGDYSDN
jgi:hypothetical protein